MLIFDLHRNKNMAPGSFNDDQDFDEQEQEVITLEDPQGKTLECYVDNVVEQGDYTYLVLSPVDIPLLILLWEDEEEVGEDDFTETQIIESEEEIAELFPNAKAVLDELNLSLKHTGFILTASGERPPIDEDQVLTLEVGEEDEEEDIEGEDLQFIASFRHEDQQYSIYSPIEPILFFAREDSQGRVEIMPPDEPEIQEVIAFLATESLN